MRKKSIYLRILLIIVILTVILNLIAFSKAFCDWYSLHIYPAINAVVGTLTGWSKVAIGEIIMYLGALMVVLLAVFSVIGIVMLILKKKKYLKFWKNYSKTCLFVLVVFLFVYTTNWFIPFRGSVLKVGDDTRTEFSFEELSQLRNDVVIRLNETADQIPRDKDGHIICDLDQKKLFELMKARSDEFPKLKGHYSPAKVALCSDELEWMGIGGYNYIYSMEPTINKYISSLYMPISAAHELCHHKGYYFENEATFISCIILAECDDPYLRYSGLLEMQNYIEGEFWQQAHELAENDPNLRQKYEELLKKYPDEIDDKDKDWYMASIVVAYTLN